MPVKLFIAFLLYFSLSLFVYASAADIKTIHVKDNLYVLISPHGGNVTVSVGEDGTFLIDDQLADRSEIIQAAAKEINKQDIKFILNTHYHFDHSGNNEFFGEKNAIIVAHDNVRQRLSTRQFITYFKREMLPMAKVGLPTVTFADNMTLHYNNDDIRFIHTPAAHTDGDVVAHFTQSNVIVGGDLLFNGFYPFIDTEHGGSIKGLIAGVDVMLNIAQADTIIIPGHGGIMNKIELQAYRYMLATITAKIEALINAGKTLEQVISEQPTAEFDEKLGGGLISPDTFVSVIYNNLTM
ncbi:MAG: MBL fold metallo-hydrolase [Methylophaga sp.]|nr:MAG: MBL fold metallo-hydrolase [Methylophaga sp.]